MRLERDPANSPFVGSWSRAEHASAIAATDREHWIIETVPTRAAAGFLIALDLQACGRGVHIKRIVVDAKDRGLGREAVERFCAHAFADLGAPFVWLDVLARNGRALAAYRAAGLVPRSLPEQEVAEWARAVGGFDDGSVLLFRTAPLAVAGAALVLRDVSEHDLAALFSHQSRPQGRDW